MAKYIKGKDGKFKGSLPSSSSVPKPPSIDTLPSLPSSKVMGHSVAKVDGAPLSSLSDSFSLGSSFSGGPLKPSTDIEYASFYVTGEDMEFKVPANIIRKLDTGDYMHFADGHMLFTDNYGDSNAIYHNFMPIAEPQKVDLTNQKNVLVKNEIEDAKSFSDLSDKTKNYFKHGGCAILAEAIYRSSPGSSLNAVVGIADGNINDSVAAHIYVTKGSKVLDAFGATEISEYDFAIASGLPEYNFEIMAYETNFESVQAMIKQGCFGTDFTVSSSGLIDKVAKLILAEG